VAFVYLKGANHDFSRLAHAIMSAAKEQQISVRDSYVYQQTYLYENSKANYTWNPFIDIVRESYKNTRIYVSVGYYHDHIGLMLALDALKLLENGEYAVVGVDVEKYEESEPVQYLAGPLRREPSPQALRAFRSYVAVAPSGAPAYPAFASAVNKRLQEPPFNFTNPVAAFGGEKMAHAAYCRVDERPSVRDESVSQRFKLEHYFQRQELFIRPLTAGANNYKLTPCGIPVEAAWLHDAVWVYARALAAELQAGGDPRDGRAIAGRMRNTTYRSVMGYYVHMDEFGDAEGNYTLLGTDPSRPPGLYPLAVLHRDPPAVRFMRQVQWPGGRPPPSEPPCGFRGEKCVSFYSPGTPLARPPPVALSLGWTTRTGNNALDLVPTAGHWHLGDLEAQNQIFQTAKLNLKTKRGPGTKSNVEPESNKQRDQVRGPDAGLRLGLATGSIIIKHVEMHYTSTRAKQGSEVNVLYSHVGAWALGAAGGAFALLALAALALYRGWRYEQELDSLLWKIDFRELHVPEANERSSSQISAHAQSNQNHKLSRAEFFQQDSSAGANAASKVDGANAGSEKSGAAAGGVRSSQVSLSSNPDLDFRYSAIFTKVALYRGRLVAMKQIRRPHIDITRDIKKELKIEVRKEIEDMITQSSRNLLFFRERNQPSPGGIGFLINKFPANYVVDICSVSTQKTIMLKKGLQKREEGFGRGNNRGQTLVNFLEMKEKLLRSRRQAQGRYVADVTQTSGCETNKTITGRAPGRRRERSADKQIWAGTGKGKSERI
ncbi:Guanylate cyclase 32E, partial [Eumeta japonica]